MLSILMVYVLLSACKPKAGRSLSGFSEGSPTYSSQILALTKQYELERGSTFLLDDTYNELDAIAFKLNHMGQENLEAILQDPGMISLLLQKYGGEGLSLTENTHELNKVQILVIGLLGALVGVGLADIFLSSSAGKKADKKAKANHEKAWKERLSAEQQQNRSLLRRLAESAQNLSNLEKTHAESLKGLDSALTDIKTLSAELDNTKAQSKSIQEHLQSAQEKLTASEQSAKEVSDSLKKSQGDVEQASLKNAEMGAKVRELEQALEQSRQAEIEKQRRLDSALDQVKALKETNSKVNDALKEEQARAAKVEAPNKQLEVQISGLEQEVTRAAVTNKGLQKNVDEAYSSLKAVQAHLGGLGEGMEKIGQDAGSIQEIHSRIQGSITKVREGVSDAIRKNNTDLKQSLVEWQADLEKAHQDGKKLNAEVEILKARLSEAEFNKSMLELTLKEQRSQLNEARARSRMLEKRVTGIRKSLKTSEEGRAQLAKELETQTQELNRVKAAASSMEGAINRLDQELLAAKTESQRLEGQLERNQEIVVELNKSNLDLGQQLKLVETDLSSANDKNRLLEAKLVEAQKEHAEALKRFNELDSSLTLARDELKKKTTELAEVQAKLNKFQEELGKATVAGGELDTLVKDIEEYTLRETRLRADLNSQEAEFTILRERFHRQVWEGLDQRQQLIDALIGVDDRALLEDGHKPTTPEGVDNPKHFSVKLGDATVTYNFSQHLSYTRSHYFNLSEIVIETSDGVSLRADMIGETEYDLQERLEFFKNGNYAYLSEVLPYTESGRNFLSEKANVSLPGNVSNNYWAWSANINREIDLNFQSWVSDLVRTQENAYKRILRDAIEVFPDSDQKIIKKHLAIGTGRPFPSDLEGLGQRLASSFVEMLGETYEKFSETWGKLQASGSDLSINFNDPRQGSDYGFDKLKRNFSEQLDVRKGIQASSDSKVKAGQSFEEILASFGKRFRLAETPAQGPGAKLIKGLEQLEKKWLQSVAK
ncbi:MAG: hypothetical protein HRU09_15250 [Oligoflexales bacterium]|nr:hypothetical protein [Oligoflexales bacterium]